MRNALLFATVVVLLAGGGCSDESISADKELARATEESMREANAQIGMPAIKNFQERKLAKMIFELRDQEDLVCHAYIVNHMTGELVFIGKCIGFGLPYSVQYTNPERATDIGHLAGTHLYEVGTLPQADPNGLFMPTGLSATWLMMIDPATNEPHPVYIEPEIVVSPFPLRKAFLPFRGGEELDIDPLDAPGPK